MGAGAGAATKFDDQPVGELTKGDPRKGAALESSTHTVTVKPKRSPSLCNESSSGSRCPSPDRLDLRHAGRQPATGEEATIECSSPPVHSAWSHSGDEVVKTRSRGEHPSAGARPLPSRSPETSHSGPGSGGGFRPGQRVTLKGLESAKRLNGEEGVLVSWDADGGRWVVRLISGDEFRSRPANLELCEGRSVQRVATNISVRHANRKHSSVKSPEEANKELEGLLLQTNWSAIYQLFHQRFGIAALEKLERGYVVKSAVEMTLSIVAKCFALLRSDPNGRLHCTPLHIAALQSSVEAAEVIVRDLPKLVEQTHRASHSALCPLHIAVLCGAQAIVELLLEGRADPNVRTLHDVCPLHLASTTSKEICQVLLAYSAEPLKRDVMGSTAMHYATSFKQHQVTEVLLSWHAGAERLAAESDQKRVSPLHISCALYTTEDDMPSALHLLANGAKLWQTDISGASAREVVPGSRGGALQQFFEKAGDQPRNAAQHMLEERYLAAHKDSTDDAAGDADASAEASDQEGENRQAKSSPNVSRASKDQFNAGARKRLSTGIFASGQAQGSRPSSDQGLRSEIERLKKELEESHARCKELEQLQPELDHACQKITLLEQTNKNHEKVCQDWQALCESSRNQHQAQLEEVQKRHAEDRAAWEETAKAQLESARNEARQSSDREWESSRQELEARVQEAESRLRVAEEAESRLRGVEAELAAVKTEQHQSLGQTLGKTAARAEVESLHEAMQKGENLRQEASAKYQELREAILVLCGQRGLSQRVDSESPLELLAPIAERLSHLQDQVEAEMRALHEQVRRHQEEQSALRAARAESDDRCVQLACQVQEAENKASATVLKLESEVQGVKLETSQATAKYRAEAEVATRRAEEAEDLAAQAQPTIDDLRKKWIEEQAIRKRLHNQIQDMKGAIRVFCRFRPLVRRERETGDTVVLRRQDAMSVDLARAPPNKDTKSFQFDSVFEGGSTQEEVFSDCRDLVQSAVDGYNVTIFAYGQTGAGKTHTMYGTVDDPGLAPRTIRLLFEMIQGQQRKGGKTFKVKTYMIEVYKQDIVDLLSDQPQQKKSLEVKRDMGRGMMYVDGVSERLISGPHELEAVLAEGEKKRRTASTKMNSASSRSHLLLSIIVECSIQETEQVLYGKITLCDLAGSERPKKSEVAGDALKEAIEINKSLSALGDVIEALTKGSKSVPYRNHKLTMLMQDSLGGSAKTLMFVNCSPASSNAEETLMSLKWASRARQVTNDIKRNADSKEVARLKQVIAMMSQAQNVEDGEKMFSRDGARVANDVSAAMAAGVGMA